MTEKIEFVHIDNITIDKQFESRLPDTKPGEFEGLVDSIKKHSMKGGILVPLVLTDDNLLLDGHRRLKAAREIGMEKVPALRLPIKDVKKWGKAFAIALNLRRRQLNDAQKADLASSLLRIESAKAKKRQKEGRSTDGKAGGRGKKKTLAPNGAKVSRSKNKAAAKTAEKAGVSAKTIERVERVKKADPELANRMLAGKISIAGAEKKVAVEEIKKKAAAEPKQRAGLVKDLTKVAGKYRCIYADPPWEYGDSGTRGAAAGHYPTMAAYRIAEIEGVRSLVHKDGGFLWLWTTWPMIRDQAPHDVLDAWGFRWVGEIVWNKVNISTGRWLRPITEVLILGVFGKPKLLDDAQAGFLEVKRENHSAKPKEARALIEKLCVGPRIELFAREPAKGWDRWGLEA